MLTFEEKQLVKEQIKAEIDELVSEEVVLKKALVPIQRELFDLRHSVDAENHPKNTPLVQFLKKIKLKKLTTSEKIAKLEEQEMEIEEQLGFLNIAILDLQEELLDLYSPERDEENDPTG